MLNQITYEMALQGPFQDAIKEEQEFYPRASSQSALLTRQPAEGIQLSFLRLTLTITL